MLRPRPDLDAIDRELEELGRPREDVSELVAKYAGLGRSMPPFDRMMAMLSEPEPAAAQAAARSDAPPSAAPPSNAPPSDAEDPDHDDFELLVDDEDMDSVEEDDELESVA